MVGILSNRMWLLNGDILAGNAARQWLLLAVRRGAGEREHCPLTFEKGDNGVEVSFS